MGYWKCPKCGSNDTYQGTEIVSEYKQGKSVGFENEFGVTVSQNVSGGTSHKQITVTKCRGCDSLLGEKDYHLTTEEHQQRAKQQQAQAEKEIAKSKKNWETAKHFLEYIIVLGFGFGIGGAIGYGIGNMLTTRDERFYSDKNWTEFGFYPGAFVGEVIAAIVFVFFKYRGDSLSKGRIIIFSALLVIEFIIIAVSVEA